MFTWSGPKPAPCCTRIQLSDNMLAALDGRRACLLGTHGMICFHENLEKALWLGIEVETLARQYWHARQAGDPVILSAAQMQEVIEKFTDYGKQPAGED